MHGWEGLSLILCYWSRSRYFVLELAAVAVIPPKGQKDEFWQPVAATQGNLFSSAQCLQGFRWLTLGSAETPPKSQLCCSRSGFGYSIKHCPFDVMVRKAWTGLSRFHSIPRGRIQDYSTPTHLGRDNWHESMFSCFPTHKVHWHRWIIFTKCSVFSITTLILYMEEHIWKLIQ